MNDENSLQSCIGVIFELFDNSPISGTKWWAMMTHLCLQSVRCSRHPHLLSIHLAISNEFKSDIHFYFASVPTFLECVAAIKIKICLYLQNTPRMNRWQIL